MSVRTEKGSNGELYFVDEQKIELANKDRGKWKNKTEFMLACLGSAIGYGNVWRFPFLCYKNGGSAFLIPYGLTLVLAAYPLYFMEMALGQYFSQGPNIIFNKMGPIYKGIGYSMVMISALISIYFNLIFAWSLFYLFASFTSVLPWTTCDNKFNAPNCYTKEGDEVCRQEGLWYFNKTCVAPEDFCGFANMEVYNESFCLTAGSSGQHEVVRMDAAVPKISSSEDYFRRRMLGVNGRTWEDMGAVRWEIVGCLALAWVLTTLCTIKGVKSSGKVVYVTATAPFVVLTAFLVRGLTLEGAYTGIQFYLLKPNMSKLLEIEVWNDAATQIFYSLGSSFGIIMTLASYNNFRSNCLRDSVVIVLCNSMTSIYAGFAIFGILGFMAKELQVEVKDVVESGSGLAFIAYPEALAKMPFPTVWAVLFFLMLITLGIDSQILHMETIATAIFDQFPVLRVRKSLVTILIAVILFLCGITMCLEGGLYMFELFNQYSGGISLIIVGIVEIIVVQYGYGFERLIENIRVEMGIHIPGFFYSYLYITWRYFSPFSLVMILFFSFYYYVPASSGDYEFPPNIQSLGWCICAASVICIPIGSLAAIVGRTVPFKDLFTSKETTLDGNKQENGKAVELSTFLPTSPNTNL